VVPKRLNYREKKVSRAGFEPATLCLKVRTTTMRKSPTDAGFRMFAGFIASRRFDQLRPISTIFDRQLTPLLTPALGASGSGRRWLAGADAVPAGLATE
jgi:hypothetical protein